MKVVSPFEADLLTILRFFFRRGPALAVLPLVAERQPPPPCLGRDAVALVQDSLAKGCTLWLARVGGWRRERYLRGDKVVAGRLWQRVLPQELGLGFSGHVLEFLIWLTAADPRKDPLQPPPENELTTGDCLLFYLAFEALRSTEIAGPLRSLAVFSRNALCRLAFPEDFAAEPGHEVPPYLPWTSGVGAGILEALQISLAERWLHVERDKRKITDWRRMQALGQCQERVLTAFGQAVEEASRLDLARFLLRTAAGLLKGQPNAQGWIGGLASAGPRLTDRGETYRAALVLLRQLDRLHQWERRARGIGYLDEGYAAAQLWKSDWEHWHGDRLHERARAIVQELDPLRTQP